MSVADEAKAAAEAAYPMRIYLVDGPSPDPRTPFAHGYQRGYEAGRVEIVDSLERFVDGHWVKWDGTVEPGVQYQFRTKRGSHS